MNRAFFGNVFHVHVHSMDIGLEAMDNGPGRKYALLIINKHSPFVGYITDILLLSGQNFYHPLEQLFFCLNSVSD